MLYQLHELNRALLRPRHPPGPGRCPHVLARPEAGWRSCPARPASPPATSCSTGSARATRSRSSASTRSTSAARKVAGGRADGAGEAVLPPAALQALQRRRRRRRRAEARSGRAGGRAAVGPPRDAAARHRAHAAARPRGLHHRLDRRAHGAARPRARSRSTTTSATCASSSATSAPSACTSIAVCQPTVPVLAAVALMAAAGEPQPRSLTMMGGPIDARRNPTQVNDLATSKPLALVRDPPAPRGAGRLPGPRPPRLSGLPAARGLHRDEPGAAHRARTGTSTRTWSRGDLDDAEDAPPLLRRIQRRARHAGRVLPRLRPHRVPGAPAAARAVGRRRRARRARGDHRHRAADHRRRARRHLGPRPDRGRRTTCAPASPPSASTT